MIIKQAVEGLSQEDVTDIMDKVENDGNEEDLEQAEQQPMDGEQPEIQPDMNQQPEAEPMNETTGSTIDATENRAQKKTAKMKKGGYSRKPYIASI
jgi:hypothetical protein